MQFPVKRTNERNAPMQVPTDFQWRTSSGPYSDKPTDLEPRDGYGLLRIDSLGADKLSRSDKTSRSRVPVFMIDGTPVASGFGTAAIELPAGSYMVSVVVFGLDEASVSYPVSLQPGNTTDLRYVIPFKFRRITQTSVWSSAFSFHPPMESHRYRPTSVGALGVPLRLRLLNLDGPTIAMGLFVLSILTCLVSSALWIIGIEALERSESAPLWASTFITGAAIIAVVSGILICLRIVLRIRDADAARRSVGERAPSIKFPSPESSSITSIVALGSKPAGPVVPSRYAATLLIEATARDREISVKGHPGASLEPWRTPAVPPTVTVEGLDLPTGWGQWLLMVEPGSYSVRIDVPDQEGRPSHHSGNPCTGEAFVDCQTGRIARLRINVSTQYQWNSGEVQGSSTIEVAQR